MPYCYKWSAWRQWLPTWIRRTVHMRKARMFIQRGRRGWSDEDLWQFDHHIGQVIAGGLRQLAATTHGYPQGEEFPEFEVWQAYLTGIADDLDAWTKDPLELHNTEAFERSRAAIRRLAEHYGSYWD